jgi:Na+/citrate or Na+/malate symporter
LGGAALLLFFVAAFFVFVAMFNFLVCRK